MFGLTDMIDNALDVTIGLVTFGEYGDISQRKVANLLADGIEVAALATAFGVTEDVILKMVED
jgi:hypothetical protein